MPRLLLLAAFLCFVAALGICLFDDSPDMMDLNRLAFGGLSFWTLDLLVGDRFR